MSTPHTPRIEELLPAYALGALDGDDLRELEAHWLSGCEECRRQLALWQGELETLAAEVEPVQPSDVTRVRVLRLAGSDRAPAAPPRRTTPWWMAVAALLLLALALWGLLDQARMERQVRGLEAERERLSRQVNDLDRQVGLAREEARRAQQALQVLAAPGVQSVVLAGLGPSPGAKGRTYVNPSTRDALFYAFDLPPLPADKTYELWLIAAGKPVPAGTFDVDPRGTGTVRVERVTDASQIQAWAVTIEPRGGVPQPTGTMVLKG
ncbi:MAG TPA: anti-sigma factor [Thermoanaerobaculia bacterium]|jgi:anti-sigma-K factor RskA